MSNGHLALPPLSLYVHIPWCVRKCPYCDFNSHEASGNLPETEYVRALIEDLDQDLALVQGRPLQSIFFGGGTPSLFSASAFDTLLRAIRQRISFAPDIEITLEANPGTAEQQRFADYHKAGLNRLSIGVQSFNDRQLTQLGRIHHADEARRAIDYAQQAGFNNFNIDIMYALPGQTIEQAESDLQEAISHSPRHISWYQLAIEPNTAFYKRPPSLPDEDAFMAIQEQGLQLLGEAGFQRYEISAYAQAGQASVHNLNYWRFGDYLGIGAGAHGKITMPEQGKIIRSHKRRQPGHYLAASLSRSAGHSVVQTGELTLEFMMNALRLQEGFSVTQFETRTGLAFSSLEKQVESLISRQLLTQQGEQYQPTEKGRQFLNTLLEAFL